MKTLNLVDIDKSDIKYQIQKFPDGQQQVVIIGYSTEGYNGDLDYLKQCCKNIQIKSRLNNFLDLELIICAVASLRNLGIEEIHLYTPYIMGARSDRQFEEGSNNYLRDVICPIINSLNFKTVTCIDPHSDVLEACIKGFRKESNITLIHWSLLNLYSATKTGKNYSELNDFILVSPDAGASKKIYKLAEQIGYKGKIITCSKDRNIDGEITKIVVPIDNNNLDKSTWKDYIIIDDVCDGGATFINIAKEIKNYRKLYLICTHGIFSKGFVELFKYFDGIYCTNSYSDNLNSSFYWGDDVIKAEDNENFVKQLNVF